MNGGAINEFETPSEVLADHKLPHRGEAELRKAGKLNSSSFLRAQRTKSHQERKACRKNAKQYENIETNL